MKSLRVYPLHVGTITRPMANFCRGLEPGVIGDLPLICWYIEGSNKRILVDTGGGDPSQANPRWLPYRRNSDEILENALKKVGMRCDDIDIVVVTHLHWDHAGGNALFPNAEIIVQEDELRYARAPEAARTCLPGIVEDVVYTAIAGDKEISDGVDVVLTPGHTWGMQGVLVHGETSRIFIASDTLPLFKNLESDLFEISEIYVDLQIYRESMKRIANLAAFILPSSACRSDGTSMYMN
jgi:N-acyl homoserine lactone hydrolase